MIVKQTSLTTSPPPSQLPGVVDKPPRQILRAHLLRFNSYRNSHDLLRCRHYGPAIQDCHERRRSGESSPFVGVVERMVVDERPHQRGALERDSETFLPRTMPSTDALQPIRVQTDRRHRGSRRCRAAAAYSVRLRRRVLKAAQVRSMLGEFTQGISVFLHNLFGSLQEGRSLSGTRRRSASVPARKTLIYLLSV